MEKTECHVSLTIWNACENSISSLIPLRLYVVICWWNHGFMISQLRVLPTSCTRPTQRLVRLGSGLHMFFLRSWRCFLDVQMFGYMVTWNQMKSLDPVFPLNSFRGPISLCIMLGNFHQGFVQPTSHSTTVRHQQNIAIKKKAGGEAKVCFSRKLRWNSHKKMVVFVKSVGCLHSSFPIKLFKIPT